MERIFFVAIFFILSIEGILNAKVRIITFHFNYPFLIELQYKALKACSIDDFELIVFNDAKTEENEVGIEKICDKCGIFCVRFLPEWHWTAPLNDRLFQYVQDSSIGLPWNWNRNTRWEEICQNPSVRHCHVIQYALENYGYDHDDVVVILDGDNFLIRPFSFKAALGSFHIVGASRTCDLLGKNRRKSIMSVSDEERFPSPIFMIFDPRRLPNIREFNLDTAVIENPMTGKALCDTGSNVHNYLEEYPEVKMKEYYLLDSGIFRSYFTYEDLKDFGHSDDLIDFMYKIAPENVQFFMAEHFLHFSALSFESPGHEKKVYCLYDFLRKVSKSEGVQYNFIGEDTP